MDLKKKSEQLKKDVPAVFLALNCKNTPAVAKIMAALTVAYALSPIDFIPDFIPALGYLDDLILLPLLVTLTIKLVPKDIIEQCRRNSEGMWTDGKPKKWYYAIPIVIVWLLILCGIAKIIC